MLSRGFGSLAYYLDARGRQTALENLRVAFPTAYSQAERRRIARKSYQVFARTFLDLFWSSALTQETWQRHVSIQMCDAQAEAQARETGGV